MNHRQKLSSSVSEKANRLLSGILIVFAVIVFRLWHVSVVEHGLKTEEAYKPQKRTVPLQVERASIVDRFGTTLAANETKYNVSISYGGIREFPTFVWRPDQTGKRVRMPIRKQYVRKLALLLAEELHMDADYIEDAIHSKAAILGNVPYLIKENISERSYLRFKMLEKEWPGLHAESVVNRVYPLGKTASDIIGYIGPISNAECQKITEELAKLRECIRACDAGESPAFPKGCSSVDEVIQKLQGLERNAYDINSFVGKMGVEGFYDSHLRGGMGRQSFLIDRRGNFIQEIPEESCAPVPGKKLQLAISSELQAFADDLLLEHERSELRTARSLQKQELLPPLFPWIKGGAIVALDPISGEILAMASSPRCDLNDFIGLRSSCGDEALAKKSSVCQWLENAAHIANLRNFNRSLSRERKSPSQAIPYREELFLSLKYYLDFILPEKSSIRKVFNKSSTIGDAIYVQHFTDKLLQIIADHKLEECPFSAFFDVIYDKNSGNIPIGEIISKDQQQELRVIADQEVLRIEQIREALAPYLEALPSNYDKLLLLDLYRLSIDPSRFPLDLNEWERACTLYEFSEMEGRYLAVRSAVERIVKEIFAEEYFKKWREDNFSTFLMEKRKEEVQRKQRFPTPYLDYLEKHKEVLFSAFLSQNLLCFMEYLFIGGEDKGDLAPYFLVLDSWKKELEAGAHAALPWREHYLQLHRMIEESVPRDSVSVLFKGFRAFEDLTRPLLGKYPVSVLRNKNQIERDLMALSYPTYGFGYLRSHAFRQATTLGSIFKLVSAYSVLSQKCLQDSCSQEDLAKMLVIVDRNSEGYKAKKHHVGFFSDGTPIPFFYKGGCLPGNDYSGRGSFDLIQALEMSSNPYFSLMVGDLLEDPEDLCFMASLFGFGEKTGIDLPGEYSGEIPWDVSYNRSGLYAMAIGQHSLSVTPLQTALMMATIVNGGKVFAPKILLGEWEGEEFNSKDTKIRREIFMPPEVSEVLKTGMREVIWGRYGTARSVREYFPNEFLGRIIGKTSTAESVVRAGLDREHGLMKMKHVWFGAVGFEDSDLKKPEIVVVVYLRLGEFGRDAAPMALKVIDKWESICRERKNQQS